MMPTIKINIEDDNTARRQAGHQKPGKSLNKHYHTFLSFKVYDNYIKIRMSTSNQNDYSLQTIIV